ncbi:hypothetical protein EGW08_003645 [Elysia chlorotica]|uniref:Uncharacterized protein n=1 Tax=Elysia chlorotica TaxID=188477 RepID=A0A433U476_ELYCH|nr:hypothetical protein EGW08_003645 [Elysia chlorotica]
MRFCLRCVLGEKRVNAKPFFDRTEYLAFEGQCPRYLAQYLRTIHRLSGNVYCTDCLMVACETKAAQCSLSHSSQGGCSPSRIFLLWSEAAGGCLVLDHLPIGMVRPNRGQFALREITADETKYYHVVAALDPDTASRSLSVISSPPPTSCFDEIASHTGQKNHRSASAGVDATSLFLTEASRKIEGSNPGPSPNSLDHYWLYERGEAWGTFSLFSNLLAIP